MCGRFHLEEADDFILDARQKAQEKLDRLKVPARVASGEVFPGQWVPALAPGRGGQTDFFPMLWGFSGKRLMINARSETAARLPLFAASFRDRRCLIPLSYYYEWWQTPEGKIKYSIRPDGEGPFFLAGLYRFEAGEKLPRLTVLTRDASEPVAFIHPRMPVILGGEYQPLWLGRDADPARALSRAALLMAPAVEEEHKKPYLSQEKFI